MVAFQLAYRNIRGAGLRTWLNVAVLALTYVIVIWHQGFFTGMLKQGTRAVIEDEIAGGQYWHKHYDPFDPLTYDDSHGPVPRKLQNLIQENKAAPILIRQAAIYPEGRIQSVLLKGIDPEQKILKIPTNKLDAETEDDILPILIGRRMAESINLGVGDYMTVRWRDVNGTFDAIEGQIVGTMNTMVPTIDKGQLWVPLKYLQKMTCMEGEVSIIVVSSDVSGLNNFSDWKFKDQAFLLKDITEIVESKRIFSGIMYAILLFLGLLAIFDTQVLAIFRRRKEIGTLVALGMTRMQVIAIFTLEGAMHGILAMCAALIFGTPLLALTAKHGIKIPTAVESYGFAISDKLFPVYSVGLVLITVLIVMTTVTIVSFLPARRIAKLKPTDALKGRIS